MDFQLTKKQQEFFDLIDGTDDNYFLNGKPGVGKSVLTRALDELGGKPWTICAPTGLAALNAGGLTLHRKFRLPVSEGILDPTYNAYVGMEQRTVNELRYNVRRLLIDEISMVRADTLDYIDRLLQYVKKNPAPFGGIQVVVVGDFYQLPPIVKALEKKQLKEHGYDSGFAFSARVWSTFKTLTLDEVLRQKGDRKFIDLLHSARTGNVTPKQMVLLNDRVKPRPDDLRVRLCATNAQADAINQSELNKIQGEAIEFEANTFGDWPAFPCEPILKLKVGAQVMVRLNAADRPPDHEGTFESVVVNGTLGVVTRIVKKGEPIDGDDEEKQDQNFVEIETKTGDRHTIYWKSWQRKIKEKNGDDWDEKIVASFEQIPLSLSWAISMHKSQGQTFEAVHIDASKIFAPGQFYVALSRCKTLDGVTLESRVNMQRIYADPKVVEYFETVTT